MIASKTTKIKEFITLFNTICYKNANINVLIKDSYNNIIQVWRTDTLTDRDEYSSIADHAIIPLDRFPYMRTNCVCFFSYNDDYGIGTKIITISSGSYYMKSYTINLHSNIFYNLTLEYDDLRLRSPNC